MILLVGASVRALMESAAASGYQVIGIDFFGDVDAGWQGKILSLVQDGGLTPSLKNLWKMARATPCQGLAYTSGPENTPKELIYWENRGLLRGNGASVLTGVRNPWRLSASLKQIGSHMPRFSAPVQGKSGEGGEKWLLKPLHRGGGHGIVELPEAKEDVGKLISRLPDPAQYIIEEYVEGIPASATFLANGREALLLGTSRQLISRRGVARPFLYQGNVVPLDLSGILEEKAFAEELIKIIVHLTGDFKLLGINTLDFIVNRDGIWILELNPRWSASVELIESYSGKRLFAAHLAACAGREMKKIFPDLFPLWGRGREKAPVFWGKSIVYADPALVIKAHKEQDLRFLYAQGMRDIPRAGTKIKKGQPICTVLAGGASDQDCLSRLKEKSRWVDHFFREH
ncbi:ATP-grasp domain-containing protein [Candidatus Formimonas warabiya]|uniref:ATP-grasp domain-containing protein n=1 Tax=Formimonas warabiya TaxID=1761012 RepID=A0A3G1KNK4_FORW1|nr:ATP-grasp domain-containing protein [Candidatus Formimonas warabiya]ATW24043.1 hypothetical protein DCMF_03885 [Candidatus Formimonas warabiya]